MQYTLKRIVDIHPEWLNPIKDQSEHYYLDTNDGTMYMF